MAVTIARTPWVDDDGSGQTGTVINNAVKTSIYNEIDGALAQVAQLAGGNSFAGTQLIASGDLLVSLATNTLAGKVAIAADLVVRQGIAIQNINASNTGNFILFFNSGLSSAGNIAQAGATGVIYGTASDARLKDDDGRAADVSALRAVIVHDFTWTADGRPDRGVFAQEAAALFPRAILAGTDETTEAGHLARPWMTDYSKFVPDLIVGWQQHDAALDALRARLDAISTVPSDPPGSPAP